VHEVDEIVASSALLDRYLAAYGQDTQEARKLLRNIVARRSQIWWPSADFGPPEPSLPSNRNEWVELAQQVLHLMPRDDAQKWFQGRALQLANELALSKRLVISQLLGNDLPMPLLKLSGPRQSSSASACSSR